MLLGASTACFHGEFDTEVSLELLGRSGIKNVEIFLESYYEYTPQFGQILAEIKEKHNMNIYSIHSYVLHFESQLFKGTQRQMEDAEKMYRAVLYIGKMLHAQVYVMHGIANVKHINMNLDMDLIANRYNYLNAIASEYGIKLSIENVHWCFYSKPGFISDLRERGISPYCTLDIKQAIQSNNHYSDFITDMQWSIINVHISDYDDNKKLFLPGRGNVDFTDLFSKLKAADYDGQLILELYRNNFSDISDILNCFDYLNKCYSVL